MKKPKIDKLITLIGKAKRLALDLRRHQTYKSLDKAESVAGWELAKSQEIDLSKLHPCKCTAYNGGACYNCINGFHKGCDHGCKTKNSKHMGLRIVCK